MIPKKQHIVFDDLQNAFEKFADRTAILDKDGQSYTYSEFQQYIAGSYQKLEAKGVQKGAKVLVAVPMSMQLYAILEALFALGATAIFLDPWMKGKKMGSVIRQVEPDLFIVTKRLSRITWLLSATWKLKKWKIDGLEKSSESYSIASVADNDNALITFTSGTSGKPKGANRTFSFLHAQAETLKGHLVQPSVSVDYTNFPIVGLANFAVGNTVAIPQLNLMKIHKAESKAVTAQLMNQEVNRLIVSPSLLKKTLETIPQNRHLKSVITGGAPISIGLVKTALKLNSTIVFEAIYGSTEAEPICITTFNEINKELSEPLKGVYVGQPVPEIQMRVIEVTNSPVDAEQFEATELQEKSPGEIVVTGNHVNQNYYENPDAFRKHKITDKAGQVWHRTGDIGYIENGVVYLVGRDHRIMQHKGETIYPYPIEQLIEIEFGIDDLGYIQKNDGQFILHYHAISTINHDKIKATIRAANYPIDTIIYSKKPLPRDARHKSKLQIEDLVI